MKKSNCTHSLPRRTFLGLAGSLLASALGTALPGCTKDTPPNTTPPSAPPYVDDGLGWPVFRGPYLQRQARITAFVLQADVEQLKRLCDRCLNTPAGGQVDYAPLAPCVLLVLADMQVSSLDARDGALGWMAETELGIWVPSVARAQAGGLLIPDRLVCFLPYVFVDNPYAIATGREVYGFSKTLGLFQKSAGPELALDVWGFERFEPEAEGKPQRLLELRRVGAAPSQATQNWASWDEARTRLPGFLPGSARDEGLEPEAAQVRLVFLKQFRAAADTQRACYQAIVEAPASVRTFHGGGTLQDTYQLVFHDLASHPLPQLLGLSLDPPQANTRLAHPLAAFWLHVDFSLDNGLEVWRA